MPDYPNRARDAETVRDHFGLDSATGRQLLADVVQAIGLDALSDGALATLAAAHEREMARRERELRRKRRDERAAAKAASAAPAADDPLPVADDEE